MLYLFSFFSRVRSRTHQVLRSGLFLIIKRNSFATFTSSPIIPVKHYSNADALNKQIQDENQGKSGVYRWTNKTNGKTYVGSSCNLRVRLTNYYNVKHLSKWDGLMVRALLKFGYSNFKLEILEYCLPEDVINREQYYLDLLQPEYNIYKVAGSPSGYKHTEETLAKLREIKKGNKHPLFGKNISDETKAKISPPPSPPSLSHPPPTTHVWRWGLGKGERLTLGGGVEGINLFLRFEDVRVILGHRTKLPPPLPLPSSRIFSMGLRVEINNPLLFISPPTTPPQTQPGPPLSFYREGGKKGLGGGETSLDLSAVNQWDQN